MFKFDKKMKKTAFIFSIIIVTAISSCSMAKLDKYPGVKLDSIPAEFRGHFYFKLGKNSHDPKDSIFIIVTKHGWKQHENKRVDEYKLSNDVVFSKVGEYFVVSNRDDNFKKYWNSWIILPKKNNFEIYPMVSVNQAANDKLSKYLTRKIEVIGKDSISVYEMNDEALVKYFEKEIKGNKTFEIVRINK
jgi:hypothetical protein